MSVLQDFGSWSGGLPVGAAKAYNADASKVTVSQVASYLGAGYAARIVGAEAGVGLYACALGSAATGLYGDVTLAGEVSVASGRVGIQVYSSDGTSVFAGARQTPTSTAAGARSWLHISGTEWIRFESNEEEGGSPSTTYYIQVCRSLDDGATWGTPTTIASETGVILWPTGAMYYPATGKGILFVVKCVVGVSNPNSNCTLHVLRFDGADKMATLTNQSQVSGLHTNSEGRPLLHSSGATVYPISTGPNGSDPFTYDFLTGLLVSTDNFATCSAITGTASGYARGSTENQIVELSNGDILMVGNSTVGYLLTQLWVWSTTTRTFTPQSIVTTSIQSPRMKHDLLRLSDGTLALLWCEVTHTDGSTYADLPRCNVTLAFSLDDFATLCDVHTVEILHTYTSLSNQLYELYLTEIGSTLRVDYGKLTGGTTTALVQRSFDLSALRRCRGTLSARGTGAGTLVRAVPASLLSSTSEVGCCSIGNSATVDLASVTLDTAAVVFTYIAQASRVVAMAIT